MTGPVRLGRVGGVAVALDWSWAIVSLAVAGVFSLRTVSGGGSNAEAAAVGAAGALLLSASVLAHELAHAAVAARRGIAVRQVTLFALGGFTEMESEPPKPGDEFAVAAAGPLASAVIGGALWAGAAVAGGVAAGIADALELLAVVNLAVAAFNLLPGLPLDGGRMLRALTWRVGGDPVVATRVAAAGGRVVGAAAILVGATAIALGGSVPIGLISGAAGVFLYRLAGAAGREARPPVPTVADVMTAPPHPVTAGAPLAAVAAGAIPVVAGGRVIGMLDGGRRRGAVAADAMTPLRRSDLVDAAVPAAAVLRRMRWRRRPLVVVAGGRMVGVVASGRGPGAPRGAAPRRLAIEPSDR